MKKKANVIAGLLYWLMAAIIIALFIPTLVTSLNPSAALCSDINGAFICLIIKYYPIPLVIMLIVFLLLILKGGSQ
jgi:hypothetical protein